MIIDLNSSERKIASASRIIRFEMRRVICHSCCKMILIIRLRRWIIDSGLTIIVEICFILFENLKKHGIFKK